jgi:hypothetical protein
MLFADFTPRKPASDRSDIVSELISAQDMLNRYWEMTGASDPERGPTKLDYIDEADEAYPFRTILVSGKSPWQTAGALIAEIERRLERGDKIVTQSMPMIYSESNIEAGEVRYTGKAAFAILAERYRR